MADKAAPKAMGGLSNREQEILVAALSKCLKNGDIQIDYAKLAAETGLKDARVASATWSPIKKKLFGIASAQAGTASKVTKTKTPRKRKELEEPKTPSSTTKKAAKSAVYVNEEQDEAAFGEDASEIESKVKGKVNVSNGADASSALEVEMNGNEEPPTKDDEGDSTMVETPEPVEKSKGKATIANDMSSGDMSPPPATPAPTKAKKAAAPKPKATPKTPKTPTGGDSGTATNDAAETPVPDSSGAKKRGRKTKAQKEAEAAAAGENGTAEIGEDGEAEKPAKKPRKTPVKKAKKEDALGEGEAAGAGEGGAGEKETPIKKPRKTPVKKPKKEVYAEDGGAADSGVENGDDGKKEKPVKKPRKTPVKKKKEETGPAGEGSPAGEAVKEKKSGPKPGAAKAKKAVTPVDSSEDVEEEEEQEKIHHGAVTKVVKDAKLANDLGGKHVENEATSTTDATPLPRNWGTPINDNSPSPIKAQVIVQLGKEYGAASSTLNGEDNRDTIVVGSKVMQSIEMEDDESGDTTAAATA